MEHTLTSPAFTAGSWIPDVALQQQDQSDREPYCIAFITTREDKNGHVSRTVAAYGSSIAECRANARLIAAAPELLDTCKMLLAVLLKDCDAEAFGSETSHAEGVIAEAEGA